MRIVFIVIAFATLSSCGDRESVTIGNYTAPPPVPNKPIASGDVGISVDLATDLPSGDQACFMTARFTGAVDETREYPMGDGAACSVVRSDGLVQMRGSNTDFGEQFVVAVRLAGRGETDTLEQDSGPTLEQVDQASTSTWTGVGEDCEISISSNEPNGMGGYHLVGTGDCFGTIDAAPGSSNTRSIRFREFSFEADYRWP